jgi:hypothetical protein
MMGNRSQKDDRIRRRDAVSGRDSKQVVDIFLQKAFVSLYMPKPEQSGHQDWRKDGSDC